MSNKNHENVSNYPNSIETRVALVEMSIVNLNQTLVRLENKMDMGFSHVNDQFKEVRADIKDVRKEMRREFMASLFIIGGLGTIMAHGFHWF